MNTFNQFKNTGDFDDKKILCTLSTAYEKWTEEDIDAGEPSERGFESEDVPMTADDLCWFFRHKTLTASDYPVTLHSWYTDTDEDSDYKTGERVIRSYHFNTEDESVWELIMSLYLEASA